MRGESPLRDHWNKMFHLSTSGKKIYKQYESLSHNIIYYSPLLYDRNCTETELSKAEKKTSFIDELCILEPIVK